MKVLIVVALAVFAVAQAAQIQNGYIAIPLCFPAGFPKNVPQPPFGSCYKEGFTGSISANSGPCLIPVAANGYAVPPCIGSHYRLASYSNTG